MRRWIAAALAAVALTFVVGAQPAQAATVTFYPITTHGAACSWSKSVNGTQFKVPDYLHMKFRVDCHHKHNVQAVALEATHGNHPLHESFFPGNGLHVINYDINTGTWVITLIEVRQYCDAKRGLIWKPFVVGLLEIRVRRSMAQ